jgi:hypothetical protein
MDAYTYTPTTAMRSGVFVSTTGLPDPEYPNGVDTAAG